MRISDWSSDVCSSDLKSGPYVLASSTRILAACSRLMPYSFAIDLSMQHTDSILAEVADRTPRLSIIVATWNAARTLDRCLSSIVGQDFPGWELLIADGDRKSVG